MYVTLRLGESGEERKISSVSWELAYPLLRRNGQKAKSKLRGGLCCNSLFFFYLFILGFKMVLDGKPNV